MAALLGGGATSLLALGGAAMLARRWGLVESAMATPRVMRDHRLGPFDNNVLSIVRGNSVTKNLRAALDAMGGLRRFLAPRDHVLIKPNIAWDRRPEQGATTNPELVAELVRACRDAGVEEVHVLDCPVDDPTLTYHRSGILDAARNAGATVLFPKPDRVRSGSNPGSKLSVAHPRCVSLGRQNHQCTYR